MKENILISVLMSVYNTEPGFLREAIESILNQTYNNFEFIIIDDCSDVYTKAVIESYSDSRIKIIRNTVNLGLTKSLNIGLKEAQGKYIARMDADDISLKDRLYEQVKYMEANKDITVLGSHTQNYYNNKINSKYWSKNIELIKIRLLFFNAGMAHPTAFFRKEHIDRYKIEYDENIKKAQDYAMWVSIIQHGKMDILPKVLLKYRVHKNQISIDKRSEQIYYEKIIIEKQLKHFKLDFSKSEKEVLYGFNNGNFETSPNYLDKTLCKLIKANNSLKLYNTKLFNKEINRIWFLASIKRIINTKNRDMFFSIRTLNILKLNNLLHLLKYIFIENSKINVKIYGHFQINKAV